MKAYSAERREALVRRMMAPENALVSALARETGITEQTLYTWRRQAKGQACNELGVSLRTLQRWVAFSFFQNRTRTMNRGSSIVR
jgi:hypothetical protein